MSETRRTSDGRELPPREPSAESYDETQLRSAGRPFRVAYRDEAVTLYEGDARDVLPALLRRGERIDHVITDPPYDIRTHGNARTSSGRGRAQRVTEIPIDFAPLDVERFVPLMLGAAQRWIVAFCALEMLGRYQLVAGEAWVRGGFWRRPDGAPQFTGDRPGQPGEGLAIMHRAGPRKRWNGHGGPAFWENGIERVDRVHPTQKPEALLQTLIAAFTDPGEVVLDPFAGAGTTLVAAKRLGRKAIGVETDPAHVAHAIRRLRQGALDLFEIGADR